MVQYMNYYQLSYSTHMVKFSDINLPLLSAIVPVSNMAGKLGILQSWLSQIDKYPMEVILVHDYKDRDTETELNLMLETINNANIKLFTVEFGSPGLSRNFGLSKTVGCWIVFWDSDDLPHVDMVMRVLLSESFNNFQAIIGEFTSYNLNSDLSKKHILAENHYEAIALMPGLWRFIFKKKALTNIQFQKILMAEDQIFIMEFFAINKNITTIHQDFYTYFVGVKNSLSSNRNAIKDLEISLKWTGNHIKVNFNNNNFVACIMFARQTISALKHGELRLKLFAFWNFIQNLFIQNPNDSFLIFKGIFKVLKAKNE